MNRKALAIFVIALALIIGACSNGKSTKKQAGKAAQSEQESIATGFERLTKSQQVPTFDYSQERQTLIDVLGIRAHGTHGTAIGRSLMGGADSLIWWCPTQGAPVPSTYQLSSAKQWVDLPGHGSTLFELDQGEPTGVYVGESQATWIVCLDDNGTPFGKYWEGPVEWTAGVVNGLPGDSRARVDEITFEFTEAEGE